MNGKVLQDTLADLERKVNNNINPKINFLNGRSQLTDLLVCQSLDYSLESEVKPSADRII